MLSDRTLAHEIGLSGTALAEIGETPLASLPGLSCRLCARLESAGFRTVADLAASDKYTVLAVPYFKGHSLSKVKTALSELMDRRYGPTFAKRIGITGETLLRAERADISDLSGLSPRIVDRLMHEGIQTVGDLARCSGQRVAALPYLGQISVQKVELALREFVSGENERTLGEQTGLSQDAIAEMHSSPVEALPGLSTRLLEHLILMDIHTVGQLASCQNADLLRSYNLGSSSVDKIRRSLLRFKTGERSAEALALLAPREKRMSASLRQLSALLESQPSLPREMTLVQIGTLLGVSRQRAQQLLDALGVRERKHPHNRLYDKSPPTMRPT